MMTPRKTSCCGSDKDAGKFQAITAPAKPTSSRLTSRDILGGWGARWGIRRMHHRVEPGMYALHQPDASSPVLVTSNYKLTFDAMRRELSGIKAWILVLDTGGINVWCAAGKGTFSTGEVLNRIENTGIARIVEHRTLILPQLGATGVDAQAVREASGWKVAWGPVFARDLPDYLAAGLKKTSAMRTIPFGFIDRAVLVPIELVQALRWLPISAALLALFALPMDGHYASRLSGTATLLLSSIVVGAVVFPLSLPWLPFRAFGLKGLVLGASTNVALAVFASIHWGTSWLDLLAVAIPSTALTVWLAMNFTGATTFTSQTGATREVQVALKPLIASSLTGFVLGAARLVWDLIA
jgi:CO dehydrogenase/acetyl-CoA synthase delta subunit